MQNLVSTYHWLFLEDAAEADTTAVSATEEGEEVVPSASASAILEEEGETLVDEEATEEEGEKPSDDVPSVVVASP